MTKLCSPPLFAFILLANVLSAQVNTKLRLSGVFINEVAGSGTSTLSNDWIEIYNSNNTAVDLDSVYLSDNKTKLQKFVFKDVVLPAKDFIVIEADDILTVSTNTKAAFGINNNGEKIYLTQMVNGVLTLLDVVDVPASLFNSSYGRQTDGSANLLAFHTPTPSVSNNEAKQLINCQFSQPRGLYDAALSLTLTSPAGATIRYTTNSTVPTPNTGTVYTEPISISANTVVKAIAYSATSESKVITNTYILTAPTVNGLSSADKSVLIAGLKEIPVIVIGSDAQASKTEAACSFEYFNKFGENKSVFADAGFNLFGNASTSYAKANMRIHFRSEYGYKKLKHKIFERAVGEVFDPVEEFNNLDLKTGQDASGSYGLGGTCLSDFIAHGLTRQMEDTAVHVRFVHVFLNGAYHGVYALREHLSTSLMEDYYGGDKTTYDNIDATGTITTWKTGNVTNGTIDQWADLQKYATTNFQEIKKRVNIKHFIDFMMLFFIGDMEWEYRALADHEYSQSKWVFQHNDFDGFIRRTFPIGIALYTGKLNTAAAKGPLDLFTLAGFGGSNLEYKTYVKDRVLTLYDETSLKGALSVNNLKTKTQAAFNHFAQFGQLETDRWKHYTLAQRAAMVKSYIDNLPTRVQKVKNFLSQYGLQHTLKPVVMSLPAGQILSSEAVTMSNPNPNTTIYYTLNGDDVVFDNAVATGAKTYTVGEALPLELGKNIVKVRAFTNGNFGPLTETTYIVAPLSLAYNAASITTHFNTPPQYSDLKTMDLSDFIDYKVYPNPTTGFVNIDVNQGKIEKATIRVVSLLGQVVVQREVYKPTAPILIELDKVPAGQYIIFMDIKGKPPIAKKLTLVK